MNNLFSFTYIIKNKLLFLLLSVALLFGVCSCSSSQSNNNRDLVKTSGNNYHFNTLWNYQDLPQQLNEYQIARAQKYRILLKNPMELEPDSIPVISNSKRLIDYPRFMDDTGFITTFQSPPKKVAVLFSSYAEVWKIAGGDIAITVQESVTRDIVSREDVHLVGTGSGKEINFELLLSYQPDLVIMTADFESQVELANRLRVFNIPVLVYRTDTFFDYLKMLSAFTTILNTEKNYERYGTSVMDEIEDTISTAATCDEKPRVLFLRAYSYGAKVKATEHFVGQMLKDLGAINIAEYGDFTTDTLSPEVIAASDVDYILISMMGEDEASIRNYIEKELLTQPVFSSLPAVKQKKYYILPKDMFSFKPNQRWGQAYRYLASLIYPQLNFK